MATIPKILPVFPLSGVIIPPGAVLPFSIFEPRYIAMIEDVMKHGRYLIITQPKGRKEKANSRHFTILAPFARWFFLMKKTQAVTALPPWACNV